MDASDNTAKKQWHYVADSELHGRGVFARCFIPKGTTIMEYEGKRISAQEADEQPSADPDNPYHTFFFSLSNGKIIDGAQQGNDARWINHSCEPNCEGHENDAGDRVFIVAKRDIEADEELLYDYALTIDEPITESLKQNYACWCGAPSCRGTMLALDDENSDKQRPDSTIDATTWRFIREQIQDEIQRLQPYLRREIKREVRRSMRLQRQRRRRQQR